MGKKRSRHKPPKAGSSSREGSGHEADPISGHKSEIPDTGNARANAEPSIPAQSPPPGFWSKLKGISGDSGWAGVIVGSLSLLVVVLSLGLTYYLDQQKERKAEEEKVSRLQYAWTIKPAPVPNEEFEKTRRWEVALMLHNLGPRTAQTIVLHLFTPPPSIFPHSQPIEYSSGATTSVEIHERTIDGNVPSGLYQIVYRNFTPNDQVGCICFIWFPKENSVISWSSGKRGCSIKNSPSNLSVTSLLREKT